LRRIFFSPYFSEQYITKKHPKKTSANTVAFQVHPVTTTTYTVTYNQNLPSGYAVSTSKTWYTDSTSTDLSGSPIILNGSADMTCEDTSGNVRTLQGWNTYSSGAGSSYSFGASINTDAGFAGYTLTLYAMWSDPVAPTTGFMYWKVDGDDNNKTIHYYASPGTGRAAVVIGTNGVEHTSLGSSDRELNMLYLKIILLQQIWKVVLKTLKV